MKKYQFQRYYNQRVCERGTAEFPSDDEAMEAAKACSLHQPLTGYDGKAVMMVPYAKIDAVMADVAWDVFRDEGTHKWANLTPKNETVSLRPNYVFTNDVLDIVKDLKGLDPDWPTDLRLLRSVVRRGNELIHHLEAMKDDE